MYGRSRTLALFATMTLAAAPAGVGAQANDTAAWANFDFRPGDRVLFLDDFTADRVGNFPQRLELINGTMEVVQWKGKPWLRLASDGAFAVKLPEKLPQRFTMEVDLTVPWNNLLIYSADELSAEMVSGPEMAGSSIILGCCDAGIYRGDNKGSSTVDPRSLFPDMFGDDTQRFSRPFKMRVEVDGTYMKVYLDEKRIANIPNANFTRGKYVIFQFDGPQEDQQPMIGTISVNAGGKKLYDALMASGRVATQGIFFDVNSDRIRPESGPTLNEIGEMLKQHPELKLTVEGHTDNTGNAASNQTLSEKRAQAIVTYLVSKQGIAASRLTAKGLGATKPAASNDTAEGRQSNRRVELVKM